MHLEFRPITPFSHQGKFQHITDEQLSLVVSIKDEVTVRRLTESYIQIYFAQNEPIFIDTTGKNDLCPTGRLVILLLSFFLLMISPVLLMFSIHSLEDTNDASVAYDPPSCIQVYSQWRRYDDNTLVASYRASVPFPIGLMLPGVVLPENGIEGFGPFKKDDLRIVVLHGTK